MYLSTSYLHYIYPLVSGHLGYFLYLASMNNAAVNIHVLVFMWTYVFILFSLWLGMEFLGHMVNSMFNFLRYCQWFSRKLYTMLTLPTAMWSTRCFDLWKTFPPLTCILSISLDFYEICQNFEKISFYCFLFQFLIF